MKDKLAWRLHLPPRCQVSASMVSTHSSKFSPKYNAAANALLKGKHSALSTAQQIFRGLSSLTGNDTGSCLHCSEGIHAIQPAVLGGNSGDVS